MKIRSNRALEAVVAAIGAIIATLATLALIKWSDSMVTVLRDDTPSTSECRHLCDVKYGQDLMFISGDGSCVCKRREVK